jgi:hypothetical protein
MDTAVVGAVASRMTWKLHVPLSPGPSYTVTVALPLYDEDDVKPYVSDDGLVVIVAPADTVSG